MGPRIGRGGVKRGFNERQRGGLGYGPLAGFSMAPTKRRTQVLLETKGQVGDEEGMADQVGAHNGLPTGLRMRRHGTRDLAEQVRGKSSGGLYVEEHGQTEHEPCRSRANLGK
jgi:hypothetical protein